MPSITEPVAAWATDCRDKYAENHDSGFAGRICLADGALVWAAVVADGCGGSMEGLKVSALAVQAFVDALRKATLPELSDPASRDAWGRVWTKALHAEAFGRFKGGMSTLCGAVILPPGGLAGRLAPAEGGGGWKLFSLNVGDSQVWRITGDGKCMGITPDAPPNNANVEGHNPIRVVGVAPKADFALLDMEEFPLPASGPCWILAGSDGFFSKKRGKDEVCIFSSGDLRDVCLGGMPFQDLPSLAIRRSLANAQKLGCAEMMDNATVAMLGFRIPPTNLAQPADNGKANSSSEPQGGKDASTMRPHVQGGGAAERPAAPKAGNGLAERLASPKAKPLVVAAAAAIIALAIGLLLGRLSAPAWEKEKVKEPPAPVAPPVSTHGVPNEGRCEYCLELARQGKLEWKKSFHWANECKRRTGDDGAGGSKAEN